MLQLKGKVAVGHGGEPGGSGRRRRSASRRAGAAWRSTIFRARRPPGKLVGRSGGRGTAIPSRRDVRDALQCEAMADEVKRKLGPVDVLVLNASISFPVVPFLNYPWPEFEAKLTGSLKAAFFCCRRSSGNGGAPQGIGLAISSGLSRHPGEGSARTARQNRALTPS